MKIMCVLSRYAYGRRERGENYDYSHFLPAFRRLGHDVVFFDSGDRLAYPDFAELNTALLQTVESERPDVIFSVLMHYEIWFETLDLIRKNSPVLIVNWGTDDSWKFRQASRFFARHVDLHVTTHAEAASKGSVSAAVMLSQWAASSASLREPLASKDCHYDVSFVGSMYGARATLIAELRQQGVSVSCFGHGTENGVVAADDIAGIFRNSRISLNFSGAGQGTGLGSENGRQIKARTFEVPGAGGFLLTETSPGLERYFIAGSEVATFDSVTELVAKAQYFLEQPAERDRIARAGHARTCGEHIYEKRLTEILDVLQSTGQKRRSQPWSLSHHDLVGAAEVYRSSRLLNFLRRILVAPLSALFGGTRGPRAARRLVYELSWRLVGEKTYRASGWPGRMFYNES